MTRRLTTAKGQVRPDHPTPPVPLRLAPSGGGQAAQASIPQDGQGGAEGPGPEGGAAPEQDLPTEEGTVEGEYREV